MYTNVCTNTICCTFNNQCPNSGWLWLNCHLTGKPGQTPVNVYCQNASVTFNCPNGKTYTYPVPNGQVCFATNCTSGTNWFDGTSWHTTLPCAGDDQIFFQGCAIPWQTCFANAQVCWTGIYSCSTPGFACNCQWGAACYNGTCPSNCTTIAPKACHQTPCQWGQYYNQNDYAGCPENYSPYCVGGGTGNGGSNCTGNFSNPGTCNF
jgi:hypothetical protein